MRTALVALLLVIGCRNFGPIDAAVDRANDLSTGNRLEYLGTAEIEGHPVERYALDGRSVLLGPDPDAGGAYYLRSIRVDPSNARTALIEAHQARVGSPFAARMQGIERQGASLDHTVDRSRSDIGVLSAAEALGVIIELEASDGGPWAPRVAAPDGVFDSLEKTLERTRRAPAGEKARPVLDEGQMSVVVLGDFERHVVLASLANSFDARPFRPAAAPSCDPVEVRSWLGIDQPFALVDWSAPGATAADAELVGALLEVAWAEPKVATQALEGVSMRIHEGGVQLLVTSADPALLKSLTALEPGPLTFDAALKRARSRVQSQLEAPVSRARLLARTGGDLRGLSALLDGTPDGPAIWAKFLACPPSTVVAPVRRPGGSK